MRQRFAMTPATILQNETLSTSEKITYTALAFHSNGKGRPSSAGIPLLAKLSSQSEKTVRRALKKLVAKGHISIAEKNRNQVKYKLDSQLANLDTVSKLKESEHGLSVQVENSQPGHCVPQPGHCVPQPGHCVQMELETNPAPESDSGPILDPEQSLNRVLTEKKTTRNKKNTKPKKPKAQKQILTNEQRIAKLESLNGYDRNARGVIGIWTDIYHVSSPIPAANPTKAEAGNLNLIWKRALSSADGDPEKAIRFALMAFQEAWRRHRSQKKFPFEDPPTPDGVHRHWPAMISAGIKANPPPPPKLPTSEEYARMTTEERAANKRARENYEERYGR